MRAPSSGARNGLGRKSSAPLANASTTSRDDGRCGEDEHRERRRCESRSRRRLRTKSSGSMPCAWKSRTSASKRDLGDASVRLLGGLDRLDDEADLREHRADLFARSRRRRRRGARAPRTGLRLDSRTLDGGASLSPHASRSPVRDRSTSGLGALGSTSAAAGCAPTTPARPAARRACARCVRRRTRGGDPSRGARTRGACHPRRRPRARRRRSRGGASRSRRSRGTHSPSETVSPSGRASEPLRVSERYGERRDVSESKDHAAQGGMMSSRMRAGAQSPVEAAPSQALPDPRLPA